MPKHSNYYRESGANPGQRGLDKDLLPHKVKMDISRIALSDNPTIEELWNKAPDFYIPETDLTLEALAVQNRTSEPSARHHLHHSPPEPHDMTPNRWAIFNLDPTNPLWIRFLDIGFDDPAELGERKRRAQYLDPSDIDLNQSMMYADPRTPHELSGIVLPVDGAFHTGCMGDLSKGAVAIYGDPQQNPPSGFQLYYPEFVPKPDVTEA